ncbi:MAG: glycosyltransferase, partial [FCB group bacterium]|nr:glycosyltransferase [FCB group bacterium]
MNIAFLDSVDKKTYGGMEEWIRLVAWGLQKRQHKVFILSREDSVFFKRIHKENKDLRLIPLNISGDFNPFTISNLKNILSDNNIDILSVNFTKDIRLGGLAARFKGDIKVVWSVGLNITKNSFSHKMLTPHLINGVIVPSASLKKQITRYGYIKESDVKVIPIGIPDINFDDLKLSARSKLRNQYHLSQKSIVALTVGRFVNQKGHVYLIDAACEIVKKQPRIVFMLLGEGLLENQLKLKVEKLNISHHFVFAGMLDDLTNYWAGADLMIHPSVEEPFG